MKTAPDKRNARKGRDKVSKSPSKENGNNENSNSNNCSGNSSSFNTNNHEGLPRSRET